MLTYASEPQLCVWDFWVSLSDLLELRWALNFPSRAGHLKTRTGLGQKDPKPRKLPARCRYAHSSNPFLEFCLSTPSISSFILFYIFVQAFDTLKIPEHRCGARDPLKKVICLSILLLFSLLLCHFHMNLNIQSSWFNWVSTYNWQFSTCNHFSNPGRAVRTCTKEPY